METPSKEYRLPADDLSTVNKHALHSAAFLVLLYGIIIAVIEYSNRDKPPGAIPIWALVLPLVCYILFRQYQKSKAEWKTYRLIIHPDGSLQRTADALPDVIIARDDITAIHESLGTCIMVKSNNALKFIIIPAKLIGLDEVRTHLQTVKPILQAKPLFPMLQVVLASAAGIGLVWASFMSKDRLLSGSASAASAAFLVWFLVYCRNDKSITSNQNTFRMFIVVVLILVQLANFIEQLFPHALKLLFP